MIQRPLKIDPRGTEDGSSAKKEGKRLLETAKHLMLLISSVILLRKGSEA